jgi:aminoglycoside phosphotransferase (APT) family kinase protein
MNDVLARIHNVDYRAVGLSDYGREGQYIQRQLARWSSQYDLAATNINRWRR